MQLYGIPNCNTVKKARDWLDSHHIAHTFHDFKKQGVNPAELESWLDQIDWQTLVNRKGLTWRALTDDDKNAVQDKVSAMRLMQQKTSVIKRPILVKNQQVIAVGFDETIYRKLFMHE